MQDEDAGMALLAYSSEDNRVMHITALTTDYTQVTSTYTKIFSGMGREAPAMFKHGDVYLMATSGCSGWEPNQLEVFWSRSAFQRPFAALSKTHGCPVKDPLLPFQRPVAALSKTHCCPLKQVHAELVDQSPRQSTACWPQVVLQARNKCINSK